MTARISYVNTRNMPVVTASLYEGTLTRYTTGFNEVGGQQDVAVYQYPVTKGDLVCLKDDITDLDTIVVQDFNQANDIDEAIGIAVSYPQGIDNSTTSGQTPTAAYRRKVDVALFGVAILEFTASGTIRPGYSVGWDESTEGAVIEVSDQEAAKTYQPGMIALTYITTGLPVAVLVGYYGWNPAD